MNCEDYHWGDNADDIGPLGIDYLYIDKCISSSNYFIHIIIITLMFLWSCFLMNVMATTASNYLSPTLGFICDRMNLAYDIAGVTLLGKYCIFYIICYEISILI